MKRPKKIGIIEVSACVFLLACSLYALTPRERTGEEYEDTPVSALAENPNPYFFPENVMAVTYYCDRKDGHGEGSSGQVKMAVCKVKAFPEGILYSLKSEGGEKAAESGAGSQKSEGYERGYFYVQPDKIYLIRNLEIRQDIGNEDLIEAGTVVCQSESKAEDEHTRNVLGPHEMIKAADGKCAFYGNYDNMRGTDGFYEYIIWQEGKGLIGYRNGYGETEEVSLRMEGVQNAGFEDENVFNPYFFPENKAKIKYEGEFNLVGTLPKMEEFGPRRAEVELLVEKERAFTNGILYSMKIVYDGKFCFDDSETGQWNKKRMHLGYFYVTADKIYLIRDMEIHSDITEEELLEYGKVVCQPEPKSDSMDPEEKGWHEGIGIIGDMSCFSRYANYLETDWWESFTWQKGIGLVEYKSGRGALDEMIYITVVP